MIQTARTGERMPVPGIFWYTGTSHIEWLGGVGSAPSPSPKELASMNPQSTQPSPAPATNHLMDLTPPGIGRRHRVAIAVDRAADTARIIRFHGIGPDDPADEAFALPGTAVEAIDRLIRHLQALRLEVQP